MTGQEEIELMISQIKSAFKGMEEEFNCPKLQAIPLFASQAHHLQQKVFSAAKSGHRKVIVATNIAETSLTIPGICHVIDSCRVKAKYVMYICLSL